MIAASQAGSRDRVKGVGSCGRFRRARSAPGMFSFCAWCSPANTSSAQLLHMECAMQLAACAAGCERAQHGLGGGVPRRSMLGCAHAARMHAQLVHIMIIHA